MSIKKILPQSVGSLLVIFILALAITSCSKKQPQQAVIQEINVVEVLQTDVPIYKEFVGHVYGEKDIPIRARVEGFLEGIHFEEGFNVTQGQLLYTIDPKPFEAKVNSQMSRVAEAKTMLAKAESDLKRYKPLAELNAVSASDLDAAQAQYDAALSSLAAAKANLKSTEIELGYTKIYSPINGTIGKTEAKVGDFVGREPNPVILNTVSKIDNVRVEFFITEKEYLVLRREMGEESLNERRQRMERQREKPGDNLQLRLSDGSKYNYPGFVQFVDRGVDATTGSILVQSQFPNPDGLLRPGLYGKVIVKMGIVPNGILIPQRCVMELQGQFSVYVVNNEGMVESRTVEPGEMIGDLWLIKSGLAAKDQIVIDALQKVRDGMKVNPVLTIFESQTEEE